MSKVVCVLSAQWFFLVLRVIISLDWVFKDLNLNLSGVFIVCKLEGASLSYKQKLRGQDLKFQPLVQILYS